MIQVYINITQIFGVRINKLYPNFIKLQFTTLNVETKS